MKVVVLYTPYAKNGVFGPVYTTTSLADAEHERIVRDAPWLLVRVLYEWSKN